MRREAFIGLTGRDYSDLIAALIEYHSPIEQHFFSSVWGATQSKDANIVEKVLIKLLDRDIPETVLPIHDSFLVRLGREDLLQTAMEEAFHEVIGVDAVIDKDETIFDPPDGYEKHELIYALEVLQIPPERHQTHAEYFARNEQWEATYGKPDNLDLMMFK